MQSTPPADAPGTWTDFFDTVGGLRRLQSLAVTGGHAFSGTLAPIMAMSAATVCDLAQASLSYLKIEHDFDGKLAVLTGSLPGCLLDSQSQIMTLHIGAPYLICPKISMQYLAIMSNGSLQRDTKSLSENYL